MSTLTSPISSICSSIFFLNQPLFCILFSSPPVYVIELVVHHHIAKLSQGRHAHNAVPISLICSSWTSMPPDCTMCIIQRTAVKYIACTCQALFLLVASSWCHVWSGYGWPQLKDVRRQYSVLDRIIHRISYDLKIQRS